MLKAMFIRFYLVGYKTELLRNVLGWPKTQMEMVSSPNDEEVASSKKHTETKLVEIDTPFLEQNG